MRTQACDVCGGDGKIPTDAVQGLRRARAQGGAHASSTVDIPAGIADEQRIRLTGRGHAGERGGPAGDLYVLVRVREDARFVRDGDDLISVLDVPAPGAALGTTVSVPTLDGERAGRDRSRHAARDADHAARPAACRRCAAAAAATSTWWSTW